MRKLLIERGPAVGVWLFSMAAQLSGYNNAAIALFLLGLAMFACGLPSPGAEKGAGFADFEHHSNGHSSWHRRNMAVLDGDSRLRGMVDMAR